MTSCRRARAAARSPRPASSQARVRSPRCPRRSDRAVASGVGTGERVGRGLALTEQQVALGDTDVGPHDGSVLAGGGGIGSGSGESANRLVAPSGVAGDLGERHLEPDAAPVALAARALAAAGSTSWRASV